jgi:hypothetical protein
MVRVFIVVAAIGFLMVGAVWFARTPVANMSMARRNGAKADARGIKIALQTYKMPCRTVRHFSSADSPAIVYASGPQQNVEIRPRRPNSVSASGEFLDPWQHPFIFRTAGDTVVVASRGPDGRLGTADDISSND